MKVYTAKKIPVLIDKEDFEKANKGKSLFVKLNGFVIISRRLSRSVVKHFYLHKIVMDCPDRYQVDHINGNRLDNRKKNLRICTHAENNQNKSKNRGVFKYKGVTEDRRTPGSRRFYAKIRSNSKIYCKFGFKTVRDAARAYDELAKKHHGEFARLNFPNKKVDL